MWGLARSSRAPDSAMRPFSSTYAAVRELRARARRSARRAGSSCPSRLICAEVLEDLLHHHRREAEARLVQHEEARPRHEPAADRAHLLLAAGQRARELARALGEPREEREHALERLAAPRARVARRRRPARGSRARSWWERAGGPPGTWAMPRATTRAGESPSIRAPSSAIVPRRSGTSPEIARSVVVLPAPLPPMSATISPAPTSSDTSRTATRSP